MHSHHRTSLQITETTSMRNHNPAERQQQLQQHLPPPSLLVVRPPSPAIACSLSAFPNGTRDPSKPADEKFGAFALSASHLAWYRSMHRNLRTQPPCNSTSFPSNCGRSLCLPQPLKWPKEASCRKIGAFASSALHLAWYSSRHRNLRIYNQAHQNNSFRPSEPSYYLFFLSFVHDCTLIMLSPQFDRHFSTRMADSAP